MRCGIYATEAGCGWRVCDNKNGRIAPAVLFELVDHATEALSIALARESRFEPALLAGRDKEGMPLNFANDIFLLHFSLKAAQSTFKRFAIA